MSLKPNEEKGIDMLLVIDLGNTTVKFGVLQRDKIIKETLISSELRNKEFSEQINILCENFQKRYQTFEKIIICSVVPQKLIILKKLLRKYFGKKCLVVGQDLIVPIKNNYGKPKQVGQDRLLGAFAAKKIYGKPCVILDFGTAITFDIVSNKGSYEGGIIFPGLKLSAEAMFQKTALLPRIDHVKKPRNLIGKNTKDSILSGLFYGYGAMSLGLIESIEKKMKSKPSIVMTGGHTALMRPFLLKKNVIVDHQLVFKGLYFLSLV